MSKSNEKIKNFEKVYEIYNAMLKIFEKYKDKDDNKIRLLLRSRDSKGNT